MRIVAAAVVVSTATWSCTGEEGPGAAPASVRDSASVRVVEHRIDPASIAPADLGEPVLRYGDDASEYLFQFVVDGALLPGGDIVVADMGASEVVRIQAAGSGHVVLAHEGQGPGEVGRPPPPSTWNATRIDSARTFRG